jgi:hypothetical protein
MADAEWLASEWMARFAEVMHAMTDAKPQMKSTGIGDLVEADVQLLSPVPFLDGYAGTKRSGNRPLGSFLRRRGKPSRS